MEGWEGGVLGGMWELGVQRQVWRLCHPPGGLTQWRAGSPAPWNAGSGHILSPKRVPALLRGSWALDSVPSVSCSARPMPGDGGEHGLTVTQLNPRFYIRGKLRPTEGK